VQKVGLTWTPVGDWSALYIVLRDPAFAVLSDSTLDSFYRVTQLATISTWLWEWSTPLAAYALWSRATRGRPGRLRAWLNASGFWCKWVVVGACFHLGIELATASTRNENTPARLTETGVFLLRGSLFRIRVRTSACGGLHRSS
jgi:hypothetical protein